MIKEKINNCFAFKCISLLGRNFTKLKVAIIHDWLISYRGGEKVLEAICEMFPKAPIYTMFFDEKKMPPSILEKKIVYSKAINNLKRFRKVLLPFLPAYIESFDLSEFDLIISTSSCVAKGIVVPPHAKHVSYVHSPMRYIWDQRSNYISHDSFLVKKFIFNILSQKLRLWDCQNNGVDLFVANSTFVAQRIKRYYNRESEVIFPPIDLDFFQKSEFNREKETNVPSYFLAAGAFVPYKRLDLAIKACELVGKKLIVAGSGPEESNLRKVAGKFTQFEISPDQERWRKLMTCAEAFIFPGVEDFGMTAVEALASGTPLIAYDKGGAKDFVEPGINGVFFRDQSPEHLANLLKGFNANSFERKLVCQSVEKFSKQAFRQQFEKTIEKVKQEL